MSYDLSEEFLSLGLGPRTRAQTAADELEERNAKRIKLAFEKYKSAIVWGFEDEEEGPLTDPKFQERVNLITVEQRKESVRLTKTGSKFFAFLLARCQEFLARSPFIWEKMDEEERDTSDVTVPWRLFSKNLKREAEDYHEYYSASGDFIFWQALNVAFSRAVEDDLPDGQDFQYRTVGGPKGLLSDRGVRDFVKWLDDGNTEVRDKDIATLAKYVVNFRDTISESASEKQRRDFERTNAYADGMRWFMREEEMVKVLKALPEPDDVPDRMLYPFDVMTRENPLPPHLWERVRDVPGGYVDDFKGKTCEEQKKICDDVANQSVIANAFSCAREPLKSVHENTCGREFLYRKMNRGAALHGMTGEIRMMITRNVTELNLDKVELEETEDPLFRLNLPELRTLRVHGEHSSPLGRFDINIDAMRRNMPKLESLFVEGLKINSGGSFGPPHYSWPLELRAVELIRTGLKRIKLRSEVLRTVDISGNELKHPLVLGKNIETLKLRNMGLREVPPAVFGLAALTHLDMSQNYLTTIPHEIFDLTNLQHLVLDGNDTEMILLSIPDIFEFPENLKTLNLGPYVNRANESGQTPLIVAARDGHEGIVKVLLKAGADVDKANESGQTPLIVAARDGHEGIVKVLLKAGADANKANTVDWTPLALAAKYGHEAIARALLAAGADVNKANDEGATAVILAAQEGHEAVVRALLEGGADVNKANKKGMTPLTIAARYGHEGIVNALLAAGANVNQMTKKGATPLTIAARYGHEGIVKMLLDAGADANKADK